MSDPDILFSELEAKIKKGSNEMDLGRVRAAYETAVIAHSGQFRKDGSPYVTHCVSAAVIAYDMGLDEDSIIAALLHDVIEDTNLTHADIARQFGVPVADIVEGVTKLTRVQYTSKEDEQMENLRKMLIAMSKDIRVILIKIADRLHNMRTMVYQSEEKQRSKSLETMEIYAPLAHRLGMQKVKWELEDLALMYLDPDAYKEITSELDEKMPQLEAFIEKVDKSISEKLKENNVNATIFYRIKHVYSIYRKMFSQNLEMSGIYDLCAFRVIVDSVPDCYNVLGIIHDMYKPVPGRFKDYISTPKPNMYQSVHTTVIGSEGMPFEVQIRTWDMHRIAEYGIAAHWKYKMEDSGQSLKQGDEDKFAWIRRLLETQQDSDAQDFFHNLKIDMFSDEVYVFSPKGDVINLPNGATPIDFAYSIHSDVGNHMVGASVNGKIVTYDYILQNGDIVEIRTSKSAPGPSRDWLSIAKSGSARTKIKQWYKRERREENIIRGREAFESELKHAGLSLDDVMQDNILLQIVRKHSYDKIEDMYAAIGYGGVTASRAVNRVKEEYNRIIKPDRKSAIDKIEEAAERRNQQLKSQTKAVHGVLVEGLDNCLIKFSRCCTPVPGDDIAGFITRGQGVSIHRKDCTNYNKSLETEDSGRWINVAWADRITDSYVTTVIIAAKDRNGLVMDIATVLNSINAKVRNLSAREINKGDAIASITLEVKNLNELRYIMGRLSAIPSVKQVSRNGNVHNDFN